MALEESEIKDPLAINVGKRWKGENMKTLQAIGAVVLVLLWAVGANAAAPSLSESVTQEELLSIPVGTPLLEIFAKYGQPRGALAIGGTDSRIGGNCYRVGGAAPDSLPPCKEQWDYAREGRNWKAVMYFVGGRLVWVKIRREGPLQVEKEAR